MCSPAPFCSGSRRALPRVAVAGGALGPAVSCTVSSWLLRRVLWADVLRAAQEGGAGFTWTQQGLVRVFCLAGAATSVQRVV